MIDRRQVLSRALAGIAVAPLMSPERLFARDGEHSYLRHVHPELRQIAARILEMSAKESPISLATLPTIREAAAGWVPPASDDIPYDRKIIPGGKGQPDVELYVVNSRPGERRPAILHTHGGGFVSGSAKASTSMLQDLCRELDCMAVSVEYRLAPETTWQGSLEDSYAGLKWLHDNADALGADPSRIALFGESAGGGHAALLAIAARDRGEVPVAFQCLIYPMLDDRTGSTRQVPDHVGKIIWNAQKNRFGWECFLGVEPGSANVPASAVPARVNDLSGLPPAFIGVGTIDLFVDEDVDYAQRLNAAGVPVELIVVPGVFHGFDNPMFPAKVTRWFNAAKHEALRQAFQQTA
ncbi:MAG: alpha/beta hydrolase [Novosphingobium sp.]|nr:alpha/beta hydrolase [Novosphingobium sp.]